MGGPGRRWGAADIVPPTAGLSGVAGSPADLPLLNHLPPTFEFGVTSSAYSIEGGAEVDGRTRSIWDAVAAVPGRITDGSSSAVGVDHHRRYQGDVALLGRLGVDAYRFSVSWSRVQPAGRGPGSPAGLDFYDRLVDGLMEVGVTPWVTLYHWDLPLELMLEGGWLERDTAEAAADFAVIVADRLGDRVNRWTTMADPLLHMAYGHAVGVDAPGLVLLGGAARVTHHLLLAHARMRDALRRNGFCIGISNNHTAVSPATTSRADRRAAVLYDAYHNRQLTEPLMSGRYPRVLAFLFDEPGLVQAGDLESICAPLDFYGVSYFHPTVVAAAPDNATIPFDLVEKPGLPMTDFDWPVEPDSLTTVLTDLHRRYPRLPPVVVTENGAAYRDSPVAPGGLGVALPHHAAGRIDAPAGLHQSDHDRIRYLVGHLDAVDEAVARGVDVRGYFHRGLTDAWEGTEGYTRQFGLVGLDAHTLDRRPRASFDFYRRVIAQQHARR